ncbi:MAG: Rieske 2Fe-2S domain-containing protein [Actinomycetota bacterium]|nr:Rieske 2Fe-2S domain-containing protein [Actinomycetota bacterium]
MTAPPENPQGEQRAAEPPEARERMVGSTRRAETVTLAALIGAAIGGLAFVVLYVVFPDTQLLGLSLGLGFASFAVAAVVAGTRVVPQEVAIEEFEGFGSEEAKQEVTDIVEEGAEGVSRRKLLLRATGAAGVSIGAATLVPLASCGSSPGETFDQTPWRAGRRVVDRQGNPIKAEDIEPGTMHTGFPEGAGRGELGAPILLVKIAPEELDLPPDRAEMAPEGVIAFSKICPHAGCAVSMYRRPLHEPTAPGPALICPCHYSTFDPRQGGKLLFGPAGRNLPQLPLAVNRRGELEASGAYLGKIGPSWSGVRSS